MPKFLIISDSHGDEQKIQQVVDRHKDMDHYIHCGDSELPYLKKEMTPFIKVGGNCDFDKNYPEECVRILNGVPVYITHGHLYNVKMSLMTLTYRAREVGAKIACFGHSHFAYAEHNHGVILINPGSIVLPRGRKEKTYATCVVKEKTVIVDFYTEEGEIVDELCQTFQEV